MYFDENSLLSLLEYKLKCVNLSPHSRVEWGLGTKGLRLVAAFWVGIPVEVTQEAGSRRAAIGTPF